MTKRLPLSFIFIFALLACNDSTTINPPANAQNNQIKSSNNEVNPEKPKSYNSLSELIDAVSTGVTTVKHTKDVSFSPSWENFGYNFNADKIDINGIINARLRWKATWNKDEGIVLLSINEITKIKNSLNSLIKKLKTSSVKLRTNYSIKLGSLNIGCGYDTDNLGALGYRRNNEAGYYIIVSDSLMNLDITQEKIINFLERFSLFLTQIETLEF